MQLGGDLGEIAANIAQIAAKSLLVYTCIAKKIALPEHDENCTKNRMCKQKINGP